MSALWVEYIGWYTVYVHVCSCLWKTQPSVRCNGEETRYWADGILLNLFFPNTWGTILVVTLSHLKHHYPLCPVCSLKCINTNTVLTSASETVRNQLPLTAFLSKAVHLPTLITQAGGHVTLDGTQPQVSTAYLLFLLKFAPPTSPHPADSDQTWVKASWDT